MKAVELRRLMDAELQAMSGLGREKFGFLATPGYNSGRLGERHAEQLGLNLHVSRSRKGSDGTFADGRTVEVKTCRWNGGGFWSLGSRAALSSKTADAWWLMVIDADGELSERYVLTAALVHALARPDRGKMDRANPPVFLFRTEVRKALQSD